MAEKTRKTPRDRGARKAPVARRGRAAADDMVVVVTQDDTPAEPVEVEAGDEAAAPDAEPCVDTTTAEPDAPAGAEEIVSVDDLVGAVAPPVDAADLQVAGDASVDAEVSDSLKAIVEALVFASPEPLTPKALCKLLDSEPPEDVLRAIAALRADYERVRGLHLVEIAGGLQIVTRPDLNEWVRRLFHERKSGRLSVQALETLAVIAYRQPVTAAEITEIRGVNTSGVLSTLVERKLIKTAGRKPVVGRPFLYATTREFLLRFGLNDVSDLPKVEDLADALGFELPGLLNETLPTDQLLPLGDPDEPAPADPGVVPEFPADEPAAGSSSGDEGHGPMAQQAGPWDEPTVEALGDPDVAPEPDDAWMPEPDQTDESDQD